MSILTERSSRLFKAVINRPETKNAVNFEWMEQMEEILNQLESDPNLRLFILTGTQNNFIAGGDLREFHQLKHAQEARKMTRRMIDLLNRIRSLPFWTLAAMNGGTYGGGWEIAAAFDFRVAHQDAKIGFTQGKFYLPPGWGGIASLKKLIPAQKALYWLATQRVITAREASLAGFVDHVTDANAYEAELEDIFERLTMNDRTFIEYLKKSATFSSPDQEIKPFSQFWESEEHQQRVEAFLNKNEP